MSARQRAANFQFLADDNEIALADNFQPVDAARGSARERLQVGNRTKVRADSRLDEVGNFFRRVSYLPSIEIASFLIESRQQAREERSIVGIAVGGGTRGDPGFGRMRERP